MMPPLSPFSRLKTASAGGAFAPAGEATRHFGNVLEIASYRINTVINMGGASFLDVLSHTLSPFLSVLFSSVYAPWAENRPVFVQLLHDSRVATVKISANSVNFTVPAALGNQIVLASFAVAVMPVSCDLASVPAYRIALYPAALWLIGTILRKETVESCPLIQHYHGAPIFGEEVGEKMIVYDYSPVVGAVAIGDCPVHVCEPVERLVVLLAG
jgi:hypothetical protein